MSRLYYGKPDTVEDLLKRLVAMVTDEPDYSGVNKVMEIQNEAIKNMSKRIEKLEDVNSDLKKQIRELKRTVDLLYSAAGKAPIGSKEEEPSYKEVTKKPDPTKYSFFERS